MAEFALFPIAVENQLRGGRQHWCHVTEVLRERLRGEVQRVANVAGRKIGRLPCVQEQRRTAAPELPRLVERNVFSCRR